MESARMGSINHHAADGIRTQAFPKPTPAAAIQAYFLAKDGNRPHWLDQALTENALLTMVVDTDSIAFPAVSQGRAAIADTLVRRFAQTYENIYSICLSHPPDDAAARFQCDWLVVMSEKESRAVRIGCGSYDWVFEPGSCLVAQLTIRIAIMKTLPAHHLPAMIGWIAGLPAPWCQLDSVMQGVPARDVLQDICVYLERGAHARTSS